MAEGGEVEHSCTHLPDCSFYDQGGDVSQSAGPAGADGSIPVDNFVSHEDAYGSLGQIGATAARGAAEGYAGPLGTMTDVMAEGALGKSKQDINEENEENPVAHAIGKTAGFVTGALMAPEASLAGVLGTAGKATGLGLAGRLGIENALFTISDEVSKKIVGNPDSIQTAAIKTGLSGVLGAGTGAILGKVSNAWLDSLGPKAEAFTKDFVNTLKQASGRPVEASEEAVEGSGIDPFTKEPITASRGPKGPAVTWEDLQGDGEPYKDTPGQKAANGLANKASKAAADALGSALGGGLGARLGKMTGIPGAGYIGAWFGHNHINPLLQTYMPSIIGKVLDTVPSGEGLKAAFDTMNAVAAGETLLNKSSKALFEEGSNALADLVPDRDKTDKLDERVQELKSNPQAMLDLSGQLGTYMPDHATALSATAAGAVNYLAAQKPQPIQPGVLDVPVPPSTAQVAAYNRTLGIAEQPLAVFHYLQKGTLRPKDVQDLQTLYPALHRDLLQKVNNRMIDSISKGNKVPLRMRIGMSLLQGQPMDSNLTPQSILAAQSSFVQQPPPQQQQGKAKKGSPSKLKDKAATLAATPAENRQQALQKA